MTRTEPVWSCPCCAGQKTGQFGDLCATCMDAEVFDIFPHGCKCDPQLISRVRFDPPRKTEEQR